MGWGSHHDQASCGLLGSTSLPSPPHSAPQVSQTRRDPHLGPHTAAGLARLKLELPGPSPCQASPSGLILCGVTLPFRTPGHTRGGREAPTEQPGPAPWGLQGTRGLLRGLPPHEAPWHLRQHAPEMEPLAGACGAAGRDGQREGASPDPMPQTQRGHWPRRAAGSRPHPPPWAAPGLCRSTHAPTAQGLGHTGLPWRPKVPPTGQPSRRQAWGPRQDGGTGLPQPRTFRNFPRSWASARLSQDS